MGTVQDEPPPNEELSRVEAIVRAVSERIDRGQLRPGEKLPSIRSAFPAFGVSRNTLVEAYERLAASGRVEARPGSGFYVLRTRIPAAPPSVPAVVEAVGGANTVAQAFQIAQAAGTPIGDAVARAAQRTAAAALDAPEIALEILIFDREGKLMGRAPFAPAHDPSRPRKRR